MSSSDVPSNSPAVRIAEAPPQAPQRDGAASKAPESSHASTPHAPRRRRALWILIGVVALVGLIVGIPWMIRAWNTVETDDAYVNGHFTFVAPRVSGQVARVFVEDNNRVRKGDLLLRLDQEPYQVQVNIAQAAVDAAQAALVAAQADARALEGKARSLRFNLEHAIED